MTEPNHTLTSAAVQAGSVLGDKYRLEYEIGRGAMGTVWCAMHLTLDQRVAIKIISREHAHSADLRRRFGTEAKAAAKLRSRYVVGVYDDGETPEGLPYIVMEYLEGECLEDRIARNGTIPTQEAVRIAKHIGRALSRAHARGIVHRDLKPANIFITQSEDDDEAGWIAKVLDFGIAKMEDIGEKSATKTGTVLGTPLFMSPEQVRGASAVDHRADLYSLGMVVYNMITGGYAFDGASFGDLLVSICTDPLPSMRGAAPWIPESLDQWFSKACARDAQTRFQHADAMIEALVEAAGNATGSRYSMVDGSVADEALSSFAKTHAGGGSQVTATSQNGGLSSASPATVTVNQPPQKSRLPWIAGSVAAVAAAIGLVIALSGGEPDKQPGASVSASTPAAPNVAAHDPAPAEAKEPPQDAAAQNAVVVVPSPAPSAAAPVDAAPSAADSVNAADKSSGDNSSGAGSKSPKPVAKAPKGVTAKPQSKPTTAPPATKPTTPPPAKKPPGSDTDIGF